MLALISFTMLGIWTAILGFINNSDCADNLRAESTADMGMQQQECADQQPDGTKAAIEFPIGPSETFEAFKNLWKEIIYGA